MDNFRVLRPSGDNLLNLVRRQVLERNGQCTEDEALIIESAGRLIGIAGTVSYLVSVRIHVHTNFQLVEPCPHNILACAELCRQLSCPYST